MKCTHGFRSLSVAIAGLACFVAAGCSQADRSEARATFPPPPTFPSDHAYSLDELVELAIHRNASLDVSRYEAEAALGLVDQVKALWLPALRYDFAAVAYDNDLSYKARAFHLATINVPITGAYNIINTANLTQILATGGKRTSGLKQAKMYAALKKFDVLRQQDAVAFDVATYYHLVCLTNDVDAIIDDALRRIRVFRQVSQNLTQRGSLRGNNLDSLQADFLVSEIEQIQNAVRAGRQQAYAALKQSVGLSRDEPLLLRRASLAPAVTTGKLLSAYAAVVRGFLARPENKEVDLFAKIRAEQVRFAKAAFAPNIAALGSATNIYGNNNTILGAIDGLIASFIVDVPIYDPVLRGRLREALALEQASIAFQREVEQLITLEIEVNAIESQKALADVFRATRARQAAVEHLDASRHAYSRELIPASGIVTAIVFDALAKAQYQATVFAYHNAHAKLKRVTADRETPYAD